MPTPQLQCVQLSMVRLFRVSSVRAVSAAESTQAVPAVKGYTKTQLTLRPQRPRQVPRVTESDAHVRISHKDGTCTRRSCAARRACSCGLVIPPRGWVFLEFVSVCLFWGLPWCPLCSRCGRLGSSLWAFLSCWGPAPRLFPVGLSSVGPRGLPVALCPCSAFCLPAVCSVFCSRRLRALCCPRFLWPLGRRLSGSAFCSPFGSFVGTFFCGFPGMLGAR